MGVRYCDNSPSIQAKQALWAQTATLNFSIITSITCVCEDKRPITKSA